MRHERRDAAPGAALEVERRVGEVAQHGARRGILARAAPIVKRVAHHIAAHINGVEDIVDAGEHVRVGHEGGINRYLDRRAAVGFSFRSGNGLGFFDQTEQFDGVTELSGELNVEPGDAADAFDVNLLWIHPETVRERSEDADFVRGIVAIDVERRLGFGIAEPLRFGQNIREVRAVEFHAREDVVAGAVDDAVEAGDAISNQSFAQHFDDGNAAGDTGFVVEVCAAALRRGKQLFAMRREERLVRGDNRLAELQRVQHDLARGGDASHQFHDKIDPRIVDNAGPICRQQRRGYFDRTRFANIAHDHFGDVQSGAQTGRNQRAIALDGLKHAPTDGAAADDAQIDLLHRRSKLAGIHFKRQSFSGRESPIARRTF